jgi:DNA polymerase I-like protein with 3'-5' exonuclease and polymerase domains
MIGKIKHISNLETSRYERGTFAEFIHWLDQQLVFQFDIETNGTKESWWNEIEIISMQFGCCTYSSTQWFVQWSELTDVQKKIVKKKLEDKTIQKIIHNALYEYVVCRFHGIIIENVYDTMLAEKVLMGGLENEDYALADISYKYLRLIMDKSLQVSFADNIVTDEKILYGITDVAHLNTIKRIQLMDAAVKDLLNVIGLENDVVLAFGDITFNGMKLDKEKWRENERLAWPLVHEAKKNIDKWLDCEPFKSYAYAKGYISDKDRSTINYNSHQQKGELLKLVFPDIAGASLGVVKSYLRDRGPSLSPEQMDILSGLMVKDHEPLDKYLLQHHRDYLVQQEYIIPAGKVTINWGSWQQTLPLFQEAIPKLKGTSEEERNKHVHPILVDFAKYGQALKLVTDLGEEWINKYVGPDGYVRTNFNQIVSTGRCASSNPNMQNITVDELVGTRYRNAFICEPDEEFVDSDYVSQELVIIAYISKDPVFMEAIQNGWDLHSIAAELVYKSKWKDAAEKNCAYYESKQKCNCKKHKVMRYDCKTINFMLAYGGGAHKLAGELEITLKQAEALIKEYFAAFPGIGRTLDFLGRFGLENGFIMTLAPFFRKRWFPYWREWKNYAEAHIQGIKYVPTLGEIERASKNQPIQGSSADITKCAMVLVREYVRDNNLWDKIKLCAQVHDQITTVVKKDTSHGWAPVFDELMCQAGRIVVPTGILRADTNITPTWTK